MNDNENDKQYNPGGTATPLERIVIIIVGGLALWAGAHFGPQLGDMLFPFIPNTPLF